MSCPTFLRGIGLGVLVAVLGGTAGAEAQEQAALPNELPAAGLAVAVGISDPAVLLQLAGQAGRPVHALIADPAEVERVRTVLRTAGVLGTVQVEPWSGTVLPYADRLARLVVSGDGAPQAAELARVTASFGRQARWTAGAWTMLPAEPKSGLDEWTHPWHDPGRSRLSADTVCGPPQTLQWQAGNWYRQVVLVAGGGTVITYEYNDNSPDRRGVAMSQVVARDAASGDLLWTAPGNLAGRASELAVQTEWSGGLIEAATIANGRLYLATAPRPTVLDLATGRKLGELPTAGPARRLVVQDGVVLAQQRDRLEAFSADGWTPRWQAAGLAFDLTVTPQGRVISLGTASVPYTLTNRQISDGSMVWSKELADYWEPEVPGSKPPAWAYDSSRSQARMRIVLATADLLLLRGPKAGGELIALDPASGDLRWRTLHQPFAIKNQRGVEELLNGGIPAVNQIALAGGQVWYSTGDQPPARIALDPATGKRVGFVRSTGVNDFCQWALGTPRLLATKDNIWIDPLTITSLVDAGGNSVWNADGTMAANGPFAGNGRCSVQPIIAYGQSLFSPKGCGCSSSGVGMRAAVGQAQMPAEHREDGHLGQVETGPGRPGPVGEGWSQFGHDALRSFATAEVVTGEVRQVWRQDLKPARPSPWTQTVMDGARISQPVAAGDQVWIADLEAGEVVCLGLADGRERFRCTTGARLIGPPSLAGGLAVVAGRDGWLYAFSTGDGKLVRRTRLAAGERRIAIDGRLESPSPVLGPPLIADGLAVVMVGRHQRLAEQVQTCAVAVADGRLQWRRQERCQAEMLWSQAGMVGSCHAVGAGYWWGEHSRPVARELASGTSLKEKDPRIPGPLSAVLARTQFTTRAYRGGPSGNGPFICADNGTLVAWFDLDGRDLRVHARDQFKPKQKAPGLLEFLGFPELINAATWRQAADGGALGKVSGAFQYGSDLGERVVAVALTGDAVIWATNRWVAKNPGEQPEQQPGRLIISNLVDGLQRHQIPLPQSVVHQGIAVQGGRIVVSCRNGEVVCLGR
ncbi:hypothetical protein LBMAG53_17840 [Planctomycetota bacterium]|nr:hypothetical protein LBMAG53_17840 [Planctomycetota bacterium]